MTAGSSTVSEDEADWELARIHNGGTPCPDFRRHKSAKAARSEMPTIAVTIAICIALSSLAQVMTRTQRRQ